MVPRGARVRAALSSYDALTSRAPSAFNGGPLAAESLLTRGEAAGARGSAPHSVAAARPRLVSSGQRELLPRSVLG